MVHAPQRNLAGAALTCPLCNRIIPPAHRDRHHLVPKSKGGRETEFLHRICHRQIHALLTESELAGHYATVEALLQHPELAAFVAWVKTKPDDFFVGTSKSKRIKKKRR
jgi:hypothetical protein